MSRMDYLLYSKQLSRPGSYMCVISLLGVRDLEFSFLFKKTLQ